MMTECDSRRSSRAAASPAAPAPITATWSELVRLHAGAIFVAEEEEVCGVMTRIGFIYDRLQFGLNRFGLTLNRIVETFTKLNYLP